MDGAQNTSSPRLERGANSSLTGDRKCLPTFFLVLMKSSQVQNAHQLLFLSSCLSGLSLSLLRRLLLTGASTDTPRKTYLWGLLGISGLPLNVGGNLVTITISVFKVGDFIVPEVSELNCFWKINVLGSK